MANITRKDEGGESHQRVGQRPFWDPFGVFSGIPGWADPFGALTTAAPARTFSPAFDVRETKDAYVFEADLPGIKENEVEISVIGKRLSVSGTRETVHRDENQKYSLSERTYGTFERTFTLSDDAEPDQVSAEFRDGVLRIKIAKRQEPRARRVPLSGLQGDINGNGGEQEKGAAGGAEQRAGGQQPARSGHRRRARLRQAKRKS
jgi:HSP20 family protein